MDRQTWITFFKEPLLHFLLIGAGLFVVFSWRGNSASGAGGQPGAPESRIVVSQDDIGRMVDLFAKTWQRLPSESELNSLLQDFVRNEIFYREAVAIGLERDDEVLKRRLRQKMEFIFENISSLAEPTDEELKSFLAMHRDHYLRDPNIGFRQVFISSYKRGAKAEDDAREVLAQLKGGADPDVAGDATMLEPVVRLSPLWDIRKQFGDAFTDALLGIKPGTWAGPIRSSFGLHLVRVGERTGGRMPELQEVRELVRQDWMVQKQKELKDAAYAKLRARYSVVLEPAKPAAQPPAPATSSKGPAPR